MNKRKQVYRVFIHENSDNDYRHYRSDGYHYQHTANTLSDAFVKIAHLIEVAQDSGDLGGIIPNIRRDLKASNIGKQPVLVGYMSSGRNVYIHKVDR